MTADKEATTIEAVHTSGPVIDLHLDSLLWHRLVGYDITQRHRNRVPGRPWGFHSDLPRMIEGGVTGAFFGIHAWPFTGERAWNETVRQIEIFHEYVARDPRLSHAKAPDDFVAASASERPMVAGALGVEGAHCINGRLERIEQLWHVGVRYLTLAHFNRNRAATPSMGWGRNERDGLTGFGRELVAELDRVGMIADLAHLNEPCRLEAAALSEGPVWVTHTGVKSVRDHPRNISDQSIDAVAESGGVIGIIFAPVFMAPGLRVCVADLIAHVDHIAARVGIEHVAIGTDFDGFIPSTPREIPDIAAMRALTGALLDAGYTAEETRGVLGENALRSLRRRATP